MLFDDYSFESFAFELVRRARIFPCRTLAVIAYSAGTHGFDEVVNVAIADACILGAKHVRVRELTVETACVAYHQGMTFVEVIAHDAAGTEEIDHARVRLAVNAFGVVGCAIGSIDDVVSPRPHFVNDFAELGEKLFFIYKAFLDASLVADDEDVLGVVLLNGLADVWLELPIVAVLRECRSALRHYQRAVEVTEQHFKIEEVSYSSQYLHRSVLSLMIRRNSFVNSQPFPP